MMSNYKILTVIGARPQFIKASVLSRLFLKSEKIEEVIVHTGQHFHDNMSTLFFEQLQIPKPKHHLNINNKTHALMTGEMMGEIERIILDEKPDAVLVYGDTNSTLSAALVARKLYIDLIHIEAGLRLADFNIPEEINRALTDRMSNLLLCPTKGALDNLIKEGFDTFNDVFIKQTGDIMKDSFAFAKKQAKVHSNILKTLNLENHPYILSTVHRPYNTDSKKALEGIIKGLELLNKDCPVVLPLHPRTKNKMKQYGISTEIKTIEPVGYLDMAQLLTNCKLVVTDSGGLQKEAFWARKPCVLLMEQTPWPQLVKYGFAKLSPNQPVAIKQTAQSFDLDKMDFSKSLYGGDNVGQLMCDEILNFLNR